MTHALLIAAWVGCSTPAEPELAHAPDKAAAAAPTGPLELPGEGYNLLTAPAKVGDVTHTVEHLELAMDMIMRKPGQKAHTLKLVQATDHDYKRRVTAVDGAGEIEGYRILVKKSMDTEKSKFPGESWKTETTELPLHGVSFAAKWGDFGWRYELDDGKATGHQAALFDYFGLLFGTMRLPPHKVQPGDTWSLSPSEVKALFSGPGEEMEGSVEYRFDSLDEYQGHPVAVLKFEAVLEGKGLDGDLKFVLDGAEYRSTEGLGTLLFEASGPMEVTGMPKERGYAVGVTGKTTFKVTVTH